MSDFEDFELEEQIRLEQEAESFYQNQFDAAIEGSADVISKLDKTTTEKENGNLYSIKLFCIL
jgi:hypothetical protein